MGASCATLILLMLLTSKALLAVMALLMPVALARTACEACVAGHCHSRKILLAGLPVTDQLAIDRAHNVIYLQIHDHQNMAISLDDLQIRLVNMIKTSGMTVDQESSTLYLGTKDFNSVYFTYNFTSNVTTNVPYKHDVVSPDKMFYEDNRVNFIDRRYKGLKFYNITDRSVWCYTYLENYAMSDFVIGENRKIFFVSNKIVYVYRNRYDYAIPPKVFAKRDHVLSVDKNDDVYFADAVERVIYKRNKTSAKVEIFSYYNTGLIRDFVFDKDNGVVFRDVDGSIVRWIAAPSHTRCTVVPPHVGFQIKELPDQLNPINHVERSDEEAEDNMIEKRSQRFYDKDPGVRKI